MREDFAKVYAEVGTDPSFSTPTFVHRRDAAVNEAPLVLWIMATRELYAGARQLQSQPPKHQRRQSGSWRVRWSDTWPA
jgi:hypothetical protein